MHVSPNIIRFPAPAVSSVRQTESAPRHDNVVAFSPADEAQAESVGLNFQLHEFGQLFAAHRIVGRIADQLEAVADL